MLVTTMWCLAFSSIPCLESEYLSSCDGVLDSSNAFWKSVILSSWTWILVRCAWMFTWLHYLINIHGNYKRNVNILNNSRIINIVNAQYQYFLRDTSNHSASLQHTLNTYYGTLVNMVSISFTFRTLLCILKSEYPTYRCSKIQF